MLHQAGAAILGPILLSAEVEAETATWTTWRWSSGRGNVGTPMEIETSMPRGPGKILDKQEINGEWCQGGHAVPRRSSSGEATVLCN
jgi:hypothetical protein